MLGGQVGIADHLSIGAGTRLKARSGVITDVPAGVEWGGFPARPFREWLKAEAIIGKMARGGKKRNLDRNLNRNLGRQKTEGDE
jgi:UDP-3-O-[3-hydroxymyristoyl] glucosamine N-acyltransferase